MTLKWPYFLSISPFFTFLKIDIIWPLCDLVYIFEKIFFNFFSYIEKHALTSKIAQHSHLYYLHHFIRTQKSSKIGKIIEKFSKITKNIKNALNRSIFGAQTSKFAKLHFFIGVTKYMILGDIYFFPFPPKAQSLVTASLKYQNVLNFWLI